MKKISLEFFENNFLKNSTSDINIIDIYFNQIGRFLSGNLPKDEFLGSSKKTTIIKKSINYFSELTSWRFRKFTNGLPKGNLNCLIHINENSHLREMLPIYNSLKNSLNVAFITSNPNTLKVIEENNLKYINPYDLISFNLFEKKNNLKYTQLSDSIKSIEHFDKNKTLSLFIKSKYIYFTRQLIWYHKILNNYNPDFVIIANDMTPNGRLFCRVAHKKQIKSFSIQHGNIYDDWISKNHIVDNFFVYGKNSKKLIEKCSYKKINVFDCGSPFLEKILKNDKQIKIQNNEIRKRYNVKGKYILVAFSGYTHLTSKENYFSCLNSLNKLIINNPSNEFIIKLHPKENLKDYRKITMNRNARVIKTTNIFSSWKYSIFSWLIGSELLITGSSTSAIEAMKFSVPVISMDFKNEYMGVGFRKKEVSINVNNEKELFSKFNSFKKINDSKKSKINKFLKDFYQSKKSPIELIYKTITEKINFKNSQKTEKKIRKFGFSFLKDAFFYGFGNFISRLIGFILLPIFTTYLSPSDYGIMTLLSFYTIFFGPLSKLGLTEAIFKFVGLTSSKNNENNLFSNAFNAVFLISFSLTIISLLSIGLIETFLVQSDRYTNLVQLTIVGAFFTSINQMVYTFLKIKRRVKEIFNFNLLSLILGVFLNVIFIVVYQLGLFGAILANFTTAILSCIVVLIMSRVPINFKLQFKLLYEMFSFCLPYVPKHIQNTIMALFCQYILYRYISAEDLGLYAIAWKFCLPLQLLLGMLHNSWKAFKFDLKNKTKSNKEILSSYTFVMIIAYTYAYILISFFGGDLLMVFSESRFHIAAKYIPILALIPLFNAFELTLSSFVAFGKNQIYQPLIAFFGLVLTIILSFILVPKYGIYGAGIATTIGWFALCVLGYIYGQSIFKVNFKLKTLVPLVLMFIFCGNYFLDSNFLVRVLILFVCSFLTYFFIGSKQIKNLFQIIKNN